MVAGNGNNAAGAVQQRWWVGPPPPQALTRLTRLLQLAVAVVMASWIFGYLGGLRLTPRPLDDDNKSNDTSQLFNWHPLLLTLAFPILMAEAVLAYKRPLVPLQDRHRTKLYHAALHTVALLCISLGVAAAFVSHTAKRPTPMPNLYSAHSWLGLAALGLLAVQFSVGAYSYLWPKLTLAGRQTLGPLHRFLGKAVFVAGIAAMATGIQEKATFVQAFAKPASVHAAVMALPAALLPLLLLVAVLVLFHHAAPTAHQRRQQEQQQGGQGDEEIEGLMPGSPSHSAAAAAASAAALGYGNQHIA